MKRTLDDDGAALFVISEAINRSARVRAGVTGRQRSDCQLKRCASHVRQRNTSTLQRITSII